MPTPIERAALEWLRRRDEVSEAWRQYNAADTPGRIEWRERKWKAQDAAGEAERALIALLRDVEEG